ncbi:MAG: iron-containing alcohol dehydrogenase [Erysipelotrichaceae bacterium]
MQLFRLIPQIEKYDNIDQLVEEYQFSDGDFFLVTKSVYNEAIKDKYNFKHIYFKNDYVLGEPDSDSMEQLINDFLSTKCQRIIAIGGGAVIDMAKILTIAYEGMDLLSIFQKKVQPNRLRDLIAIPTTCGAGSEVSNISILEMKAINSKLGLAIDEIFPTKAIIIPSLMRTIPYFNFITSSIDGLIHAIESYLSPKSNIYTNLYQFKAIEIYLNGFISLSNDKRNMGKLLEEFLIASNFAGIAFSNTGTGAVHAISYPLSGKYHVTHGQANALFLTSVLNKYQELGCGSKLIELQKMIGNLLLCDCDKSFAQLDRLLKRLVEMPLLRDFGMLEEEIITFSDSVIINQQRLLSNSYLPLSKEDIVNIYRQLF